MKPVTQVTTAPHRNHQSVRVSSGGLTFGLIAASISFWNWTLTRLKK